MTWGTTPEAVRRAVTQAFRFNRNLFLNAGSMMSTTLVTALLGAMFWIVAAQKFSAREVGVASAAVSAMALLGYLSTIGLGTLLMGELSRHQRQRGLINAALLASGTTGAVLGLAFALGAPAVSPDLEVLRGSWIAVSVFALGVALTALTGILDQALIGLMRGGLQLLRNAVFSVTKLLALITLSMVLARADGAWIYAVWTGGIALSLVVMTRFYGRSRGDSLIPTFALLAKMRRSAASHHVFNLAIRAPDLVLPLLVVSVLSATANANFYIAWMIAGFAFAIPISLSSVLYALGSGGEARTVDQYRLSLLLSAGLGCAVNVGLLLVGTRILGIFGPSYAHHASATLHVLALGVFPETIKAHYLSIRRLQRRVVSAVPIVVGGTVLELLGATVGGLLGSLTWLAVGWLAAVCVEALVMSPDVLRFVQVRRPGVADRSKQPLAEAELACLAVGDQD
jgi:O-antigen/teichoic acid export membrane protein